MVTAQPVPENEKCGGPGVASVGNRAATSMPGVSAEDYLRQSILEPNVFVVEGFPEGVMPPGWNEALTADQINNLIAYLLTLK